MQLLKQWRGEGSKKRSAEESVDKESSRKRTRDDGQEGRRGVTGIGTAIATGDPIDQEYKIRGTSSTNKEHPSFPLTTEQPVPSSSSSLSSSSLSIHPDRRANIFSTAPTPPPTPASLQTKRDSPLKPLSPNPEPINRVESGEQRPKPLHSTSHPSLRIDTIRAESSLDPRSPDYTPVMTSISNEKSNDSPSHRPPSNSIDSPRHNSNPPLRRQSDIMPPPPSFTRIARSETSTPKATSQPTNSELERRRPSTSQPQLPLLDNLNAFAQSIVSAASLSARRDSTKQLAVGQQKERDRQAKFKSTYLTLIEDAEFKVEETEKVSSGIEKQINLSSQAQSNNAIALAAQLLKQAEVSNPLSSAPNQTHLKDDYAEMKAELRTVKKEIDTNRSGGRLKDDLANLKGDFKAAEKEIDYLKREVIMASELRDKLRPLATKDELRGLADKDEIRAFITKGELRRVTTEEVRRHVTEALIPTEKKLASLTLEGATLNQKIKGVEDFAQMQRKTTEAKDQEQSSRFSQLDTSLNNAQREISRLDLTTQEQKNDHAAVKIDLEAQNKVLTCLNNHVGLDPSSDSTSLYELVIENSEQILSLQQDREKHNEAIRQIQDLQAASKLEAISQVSKASVNAEKDFREEFKLIRRDLDFLKAKTNDLKLLRHDVDALKADQEKLVLIRTDLDSLINEEKGKDTGVAQGFEAIEDNQNKLLEELSHQKTEIRLLKQTQAPQSASNHPPTPPLASASTSPRESDQRKLQEMEIGLRKLTKTTQVLDLVVTSQQQKFDGLTSDHIVQSMVHQMQQMYPQHPGWIKEWQGKVDAYLSIHLKDRLANMESRMAAASLGADSKVQEIIQSMAENQKICLATISSLKRNVEELRDKACYSAPQGASDYDNRLNDLTNRITTIETRYIEAINDIQTNQKDLMCSLTHMQKQNEIGSARNTPGELPETLWGSKGVDLNGTATMFFENINDSDGSDTPLSQRADRGPRQDREDRPPSEPNLKRKASVSNDEDGYEDEDEGIEARATNVRKIPKRRNVSGRNPFS